MIVETCQRWTLGREHRRPAGELIRTSAYDVVELKDDATARAFVQQHHYAASYPAARFRFALYQRGELAGVAVFSVPASGAAHRKVWPTLGPDEAVDLGRLVLLDIVPGNGESWFVARCFELLAGRVVGIASCSDPVVRTSAAGVRVFPGHGGTIYQATNGRYVGRTNASTLRLLPDGTVLSRRACSKLASRDVGWRYAAAALERHGADPLGGDEDAAAWLRRWRPILTRPLRHRGNHRYLWTLDRRRRRELLERHEALPYPKIDLERAT